MYKGLVTSGCSFSLYDVGYKSHGWPHFLQKQLLSDGVLSKDFNSFHRGLGANGNTLIARNTIEAISRLLDKGMSGEEILCIVEWSGTNRHQFFIDRQSTNAGSAELFQYDTGVTYENGKDIPYISYENLAKQKRNGYYLVNKPANWQWKELGVSTRTDMHEIERSYYRCFQSHTNDVIESLWNWTTLQNYCEVNNIKPYYTFMFEHDKEMLLDDDLGDPWAWKYLRDNIITDNVLTSITKYLKEYPRKNLFIPDGHPSTKGHKVFSDYLKKSLTNI
tara:strand:+ start:80 stop:910 length:831 start_codon:yes stop_codon:yes gene_type:complete